MTDNGLCWSRVAQVLQSDYDCLMLDARGHGLSDAPENAYTAEDHCVDVAGVIRAFNLSRPIVMGHSMGAATAAATAANYPDLVGALILEDPPWRGAPMTDTSQMAERVAQWRSGLAKRRTQSLEEIIAWGRRHHPTWDEGELAVWAEAKRQTSPNIANGVIGRGIRWQEVAEKIRCKALLIGADPALGGIVTPAEALEAMKLCSGLRATLIRSAGHNIRREQFDIFVSVIRRFLGEWHISEQNKDDKGPHEIRHSQPLVDIRL